MPNKKNAFSFFLDHYIEEQRQKGRQVSKRVAAEECCLTWEALSNEKKAIYFDLAKAYKSERECRLIRVFEAQLSADMSGDRSRLGDDVKYLTSQIRNERVLRNHKFYIAHANYFCRVEEGEYVPGEVAIVEFTLEAGIRRKYQTLINPGDIPLGYAFEARRLSEEVHALPIPPYDEGQADFQVIMQAIRKFIKLSEEKEDQFAVFFTPESNVPVLLSLFSKLWQLRKDKLPWKVFPVHKMFYWVKDKCAEYSGRESGFPVLTNALNEIEKDIYRYCTGLSCHYHSALPEKYHNCSLSVAQRIVFVICDHCCPLLNIRIIAGKHAHPNSNVEERTEPNAISSDVSDETSNPDIESDLCGASTYASSIIDDDDDAASAYRVETASSDTDPKLSQRMRVAINDDSDDEGAKCLGYDKDDSDDEEDLLKLVGGRGIRMKRGERKVGLSYPRYILNFDEDGSDSEEYLMKIVGGHQPAIDHAERNIGLPVS